MAKPDDHELQKTHDRLRKHYGEDIDKALTEIIGDVPKKEGQGEGVPSKLLLKNVFWLGEAASTRAANPGRKNPSWNGWDALVDRMKKAGIP